MLQSSGGKFRKRRIELNVSYGKQISFTKTDSIAKELHEYLKETKNVEAHLDFGLNLCAICEDQWTSGDYASETLLLIPNPGYHVSGSQKVRVTIPRVVCLSCSETLSSEDGVERVEAHVTCSLTDAWRAIVGHGRPTVTSSQPGKNQNSFNPCTPSNSRVQCGGLEQFPLIHSHTSRDYDITDGQLRTAQHFEGDGSRRERETGSVTSTSDNNSSSSGRESLQNLLDQKGFMVCTQIVKSGGADIAGLKAGDIFTQFGNLTKDNFKGLKSVANFVRRSANKTFEVVVLRQMNGRNKQKKYDDALRKVRLKLTPSYCHDTDGGGVLGAVVNTWPVRIILKCNNIQYK